MLRDLPELRYRHHIEDLRIVFRLEVIWSLFGLTLPQMFYLPSVRNFYDSITFFLCKTPLDDMISVDFFILLCYLVH